MALQQFSNLNARQLAALRSNTPTANDILQDGVLDELNEEIVKNYPQETSVPVQTAPVQRLVQRSVLKPVAPAPTAKQLSVDDELDEVNRQAQAKLEARRKELEKEKEAKRVEAESATQQSENPEDALRGQIIGALKGLKGAPTEANIAAWKREHGENGVYVIALNEQDVFVFTFVRRGQWQKILQATAAAQKAELNQNQSADDMLKENVLKYTILWPRPLTTEFWYNSRAGTIDTLYNVIMANSSFLQLNQAMVLTTQL